jgi:class 3 adenylate cyclase/tetratricopeptide (TPR) repeat protein
MSAGAASATKTVSRAVRDVLAREAAGDYFQAYEQARKAIAAYPGDEALQYLAVRALARSGATDRAMRLFSEFGLVNSGDPEIQTLQARLLKDVGLRARSTQRWALLREAAGLYEKIYAQSREHDPAVNAASLHLLAGSPDRASRWARRALAACEASSGGSEQARFRRAASRAEAHLILLERESARAAVREAARYLPGNFALRAATRRQLRLICAAQSAGEDLLDPLSPPAVIHYTGHMIDPPDAAGRFPAEREADAARAINAALLRSSVGSAYGSLACGAEILFAESCLAQGAELNVVLPFAREEFVRISVARGGSDWVARFERCIARARSVAFATEGEYLGDDSLFAYASELAMGLAILRAQHIDGEPLQIALWDGEPSAARAGTAADIRTWKAGGRRSDIVPLAAPGSVAERRIPLGAGGSRALTSWKFGEVTRELRAVLFGDVAGFSQVPESLLPEFHATFLGRIARVLDGFGSAVLHRSSWGDAIYAVLDSAESGARCAVAIQRALRDLNPRSAGFHHPLELRLALHYGPIFRGRDGLTGCETFFGAHVTRTARIEPITPPGEVFATEAMAAALALAGMHEVRSEYVGQMPLAKNYGALRMYVLRPAKG